MLLLSFRHVAFTISLVQRLHAAFVPFSPISNLSLPFLSFINFVSVCCSHTRFLLSCTVSSSFHQRPFYYIALPIHLLLTHRFSTKLEPHLCYLIQRKLRRIKKKTKNDDKSSNEKRQMPKWDKINNAPYMDFSTKMRLERREKPFLSPLINVYK